MKIKVWLDSGANSQSQYEQVVDTKEDLGLTDQEWNGMEEEYKDEIMRSIAWDRMDWGYVEI